MIDKDTALKIAQAFIDERYNPSSLYTPRSRLPNIGYLLFVLFHPVLLHDEYSDFFEARRYPDNKVVVNHEYTREEDFGWVFRYQTQRYWITKNYRWMLVGSGPLIVDRCDGSIHRMHSHPQIESVIEKYKRERTLNC